MQADKNDGLEVRRSEIEGNGCFATRDFVKRAKIAEYTGEIVTAREGERRVRAARHHRVCAVNDLWSIDGSCGGNATAFMNHSCAPNAFMQTHRGRIFFYARRDIKAGEEITVDYEQTYHSNRKRCRCGAAACRGKLNRA